MRRDIQRQIAVDSIRGMIAQLAWRAWKALPMQIRVWIGIDDMISDGLATAHRLYDRVDPTKGKFITLVYHQLHKDYIRDYIEKYGQQKRGWQRDFSRCRLCGVKVSEHLDKRKAGHKVTPGKVVPIGVYSLQGLQEQMKFKGATDLSLVAPDLIFHDNILENAITECFVVPALENVYNKSSDRLKEEMINWFWSRKEKFHPKSHRFKVLSKEFRERCKAQDLASMDCLHLMRSPTCMDSLSRRLLWVPYDINDPTPKIR